MKDLNNKNKNKKEKRYKIVLKRILDIFCYICTSILVLLLLIYSFGSCSSNDSKVEKQLRNINYESPSYSLTWYDPFTSFYPNADDMQFRINPLNNEYNVYYFRPLEKSFSHDLYIRPSGSQYVNTMYVYDGTSLYSIETAYANIYNNSVNSYIEFFDINDDSTVYNVDINKNYLFLTTLSTVNFNHRNYDDFYNYFVYQGSINYSGDSLISLYDYCSTHYHENYLVRNDNYILNPFYDFSNVNMQFHYYSYYYDFYNMSYINLYPDDLFSFEYDSDSDISYYSVVGYGYYNEDGQFNSNIEVESGHTRFGQLRYFSGLGYSYKDVTPYQYYFYGHVVKFLSPIPKQNHSSDFGLMFIPVNQYGTLSFSGQFNFTIDKILTGYGSLNDINGHGSFILNWFRSDSSITFQNKTFKSFATHLDQLVTHQWWFEALPYYAENYYANNDSILEIGVNTTAIYTEQLLTFSGLNVNDFMFFVYCGAVNLSIYSDPGDDTTNTGSNPPSIITGIYTTFDVLGMAFDGIGNLMKIELSKGLPIGAFIVAPFAAGVVFIMFRIFRGH